MSATYRDDRDAAHAAADALRRENDDLRTENDYLRSLLDPAFGVRGQSVAQLQGALAATTLLLGAMAGAALVARDSAPWAGNESAVLVTDRPLAEEVAVVPTVEAREGERAGLSTLVPFEVTAPTVVAAEEDAATGAMVTNARVRLAMVGVLGGVGRCFPGRSLGMHVAVEYSHLGLAVTTDVAARHRSVVSSTEERCVATAVLGARLGAQIADSVTVRYTLEVRDGVARLRRVRW